jgi:hypothetical protein
MQGVHTILYESRVAGLFDLGITPEDFDIIKPNEDLYCLDVSQERLRKISSTLLTNYWGDLLITQEGAEGPDPFGRLFIVHWDNAKTNFVVRSILNSGFLEHVTFSKSSRHSQMFKAS